jgi:LAS superfamily LD-carboxypeptidase LdcB
MIPPIGIFSIFIAESYIIVEKDSEASMKSKHRKIRKLWYAVILVLIASICICLGILFAKDQKRKSTAAVSSSPTASVTAVPSASPSPSASLSEEPAEAPSEETAEPTEEPTAEQNTAAEPASSLSSEFTDTSSLLILANKKNRLPEGYVPADLVDAGIPCTNGSAVMRAPAAAALQQMYNAAAADGVSLAISSAYRSESYQSSLYNNYVSMYGEAGADAISSRPGYSDHQTGLAADFVEGGDADFNESFENTVSGKWLASHAHLYGFIMRYPQGKESITGYNYEPWHFRYVGIDSASAIYSAGADETFEEYYQVPGGDYAG